METGLRIGITHYSCPPVVGGVEELLKHHALNLARLGHEVSVLAGMGEPFSEDLEVKIEPVLGSMHPQVLKAHSEANEGSYTSLKRITRRILRILQSWSQDLDVIIAHNVLQMPFNLAFTLALRRLASSNGARVVSWAHDSPYFRDVVH